MSKYQCGYPEWETEPRPVTTPTSSRLWIAQSAAGAVRWSKKVPPRLGRDRVRYSSSQSSKSAAGRSLVRLSRPRSVSRREVVGKGVE